MPEILAVKLIEDPEHTVLMTVADGFNETQSLNFTKNRQHSLHKHSDERLL